MRAKLGLLQEAFAGHFTDHHAFLLAKMLGRVDAISADIAELDAKIQELITPFAQALDRLDEIPGVGQTAAQVILAEIGMDMTRFSTAGHLAAWAKCTPGVKESAGKRKGTGSTGHPPGTATPTWPGCSARPRWWPDGPTASSASATGASHDDAGNRRPSSRSGGPS
jgi:hypothetical protein